MVFLTNMETARNNPTDAKQHDHGHQQIPSDLALRVRALESLLVEKGLVDSVTLDALIDAYEN
jgi:nitrile hydratase subunit alpha